jgi:hypothetical protein
MLIRTTSAMDVNGSDGAEMFWRLQPFERLAQGSEGANHAAREFVRKIAFDRQV